MRNGHATRRARGTGYRRRVGDRRGRGSPPGGEGARVAVLGRSEKKLGGCVWDPGGAAIPVAADVSRPDEMEPAIRQAIDRWGRLDIGFANAGVNGVWAPLEELEPDEWRRMLDINLTGTFLTVKYAVPHPEASGRLRDHHLVG